MCVGSNGHAFFPATMNNRRTMNYVLQGRGAICEYALRECMHKHLNSLHSTPEYADSKSQYNEQLVALPPTTSALAMRDTEIAVLDEQIEALSQEKRRLSRGFFRKKSTETLDKDFSGRRVRGCLMRKYQSFVVRRSL